MGLLRESRKKQPQISPLRCAPVEMTILFEHGIRRFQEGSAEPQIPSASLLMTRGGWVFPVGIGLRDPRSQKRDLGHPSISPSILQKAQALSFSLPTRLSESAARDDKGEGCGAMESGGGTQGVFHHLRSGKPLSIVSSPSPLSSRAKPRDLQFYGPIVEMFFDRSVVERSAVSPGTEQNG
jgi:hypothetical protein